MVVQAKLAVAKGVGVGLEEFQPQPLERHPGARELLVDPGHVGERPRDPDEIMDPVEEPGLQLGIVQVLRQRPGQADPFGPAAVLGDRAQADPARPGDGPVGEPLAVLQSQNLADLSHQSPRIGHAGRLLGWRPPYRGRDATAERSGLEPAIRMPRNGRSGSRNR